jgi:hypothetical protein
MSDDSIPAPDGQHNPVILLNEDARVEILMRLLFPAEAKPLSTDTLRRLLPPCDAQNVSEDLLRCMAGGGVRVQLPTPAKPKRRKRRKADPDTYSPIEHTLYSLQAFGFTHPSNGRYLMVPKEFQAILLLETKAVAAVVWEVMQQTIGWEGHGPGGRREWAPLTVRHFERARILSHRHATEGIADALKAGYIERRQRGARRYEYRLRWKGTN